MNLEKQIKDELSEYTLGLHPNMKLEINSKNVLRFYAVGDENGSMTPDIFIERSVIWFKLLYGRDVRWTYFTTPRIEDFNVFSKHLDLDVDYKIYENGVYRSHSDYLQFIEDLKMDVKMGFNDSVKSFGRI